MEGGNKNFKLPGNAEIFLSTCQRCQLLTFRLSSTGFILGHVKQCKAEFSVTQAFAGALTMEGLAN